MCQLLGACHIHMHIFVSYLKLMFDMFCAAKYSGFSQYQHDSQMAKHVEANIGNFAHLRAADLLWDELWLPSDYYASGILTWASGHGDIVILLLSSRWTVQRCISQTERNLG